MKDLKICEDVEDMIDKLTALHFYIVDQTANYLERELYELERDHAPREDYYSFMGMLKFAFDLGLIKDYKYEKMKEQAEDIWDAYQEAAAPPNILNAPPVDPEQLALFT
jgi:hypothetical protein